MFNAITDCKSHRLANGNGMKSCSAGGQKVILGGWTRHSIAVTGNKGNTMCQGSMQQWQKAAPEKVVLDCVVLAMHA